jgi:hypothetical protein
MFARSSPSHVVMLRSVITPSFDKYSRNENTLSGFSRALLRLCTFSPPVRGIRWLATCMVLVREILVVSAAPWSSDVASVSGPGDHRCPARSVEVCSDVFTK